MIFDNSLIPQSQEDEILKLGQKYHCSQVLNTTIEIWEEGDGELLKELADTGELIPLVKTLIGRFVDAQEMRASSHNSHLATYEILQLCGIPLELSND